MKPLFVPLRKEYFLAFERGEKTVEYRLLNPRWNPRTCVPGRAVILSLGYNGRRLHGTVESFCSRVMDTDIYGPAREIACISITLNEEAA